MRGIFPESFVAASFSSSRLISGNGCLTTASKNAMWVMLSDSRSSGVAIRQFQTTHEFGFFIIVHNIEIPPSQCGRDVAKIPCNKTPLMMALCLCVSVCNKWMSKAILLLVVTLSKSLGHHLKLCVRGQANPPTHQINTSHLLQGKGVELFVTTTIFYLDQSHNLDTCDVSIDFINEIPPRSACPGNCSPIPRIQLPRQVFSVSLDLAITCSISLRTIKELAHLNSVNPSEMTTFIMILSSIFRIAECTEMPTSPHLLDFVAAHRREVAFLIVYVGSTSRQSFIEKQLIMFRNELFHGPPSKSVVTWVADEGLYVCGSKTTTCRGGQLEGTQIKHVDNYPNSELDPRTSLWAAKPMGEFHGWACAQRRQLRSLAHTLTLFRPNILVMLDDDTFLNWRMLQDNRGYFLLADTSTHPAIFGYRYTWSTSHPVLLGGAGYVLGPHALRALVTSFSGLTHRPQLRAMLEQRGANCSHGSTCGQCVQDNSCRVVDICRDLLSPEHTCYHRLRLPPPSHLVCLMFAVTVTLLAAILSDDICFHLFHAD